MVFKRIVRIIEIILVAFALLGFGVAIVGAIIQSEDFARFGAGPGIWAISVLFVFLAGHLMVNLYKRLFRKPEGMLKRDERKIDLLVILSIFMGVISILGNFFISEGGLVVAYGSDVPFIKQGLFWAAISLLSVLVMALGLIRCKLSKKTKHLGFIPTIVIIMVESFFAFMGVAALALVIVILFIVTYKFWKDTEGQPSVSKSLSKEAM